MIPPLIPLPASETQPNRQNNSDRAAKEDLFSTLFSPSTPRASPTLESASLPSIQAPTKHNRTVSTDSEFGAFVSVPENEDPLASTPDVGAYQSPPQGTQFLEDAIAANERNKKGILDELLRHEEDPLYFLSSQIQDAPSLAAQQSTSSPPIPSLGPSLLDLGLDDPIPEPPPHMDPLLHPDSIESALHEASNTIHEAYGPPSTHTSGHPSRQRNLIEPADFGPFTSASTYSLSHHTLTTSLTSPPSTTSLASTSHHVRSPSLPPSPSRPSLPELQRTQPQSIFTPSLTSTTSRWMSSLLSKPTTNLGFRPSLTRALTHMKIPHPRGPRPDHTQSLLPRH